MRKLLDLIFSQHDLAWLDDILPDKDKKKKEDDKTKKKERKAVEPESDEEVREIWTNMKLNSSLPSTHTHRHGYCFLQSWRVWISFHGINCVLKCVSLHLLWVCRSWVCLL